MTPADLPLRLIPKRDPHPLAASAVLLGCLLFSLVIRYLTTGLQLRNGVVATIFPALIVATLYAGFGWGLAGLALVLAFVVLVAVHNTGEVMSIEQVAGLAVFGLAALLTVLLAAGLRELVIRLDEARRARDAAQAQSLESEERFRILADSAAAMMWITRPDRTREFVNRAYCEFLGAPYDEALVFDWRLRIHPSDHDKLVADSVAGESSLAPFVLEGRYERADGQWRWLRSISRPKHGPDGAFDGFIGIAFDVTETKQQEENLKSVNDLLADKVDAALAERDQAQAALMQSQKLEALGQLTGGVAHDFNNLLTVVIGALDIILRNPTDANRRQRLGEAALAAARRGERLTQQLLAFSRRQPLKPEVVVIDALIHESEPLLRRAVGEGFNLSFELHAGKALARIDAGQFEAAVLNLLLNARDATTEAGRIVVATHCVTQAEGADWPAGDYVRVSVIDDGAGMDEATVARCFEPFYTTKPVGKGTGLGLSQVYGFARQSGGGATIESQIGDGAEICLFLPVTSEAVTQPAVRPGADGDYVLKILLVEDDADVGDLVEAMLRELGHSVVRAVNVEQALRIAQSETSLGLMLTDVIMPGGRSGVDLAHEVARLAPDLPIVLSSGYTGATLAEADRAPWPLLRKPYTVDALKEAIAGAIEQPATVA
jgi:PAS domain S-box-containing protein